MRMNFPHNTSAEAARKRIEALLDDVARRYSSFVTDLEHHWEENRLVFGFKAKGLSTKGSLEVTESEVIVDGKIPLMARPFEGKIKAAIEKEAKTVFKKA